MFVEFRVSSFSRVSPPLPLHRNRLFLFLDFWKKQTNKKLLSRFLVIKSYHVFALNEPITFLNRKTHRIVVKLYILDDHRWVSFITFVSYSLYEDNIRSFGKYQIKDIKKLNIQLAVNHTYSNLSLKLFGH